MGLTDLHESLVLLAGGQGWGAHKVQHGHGGDDDDGDEGHDPAGRVGPHGEGLAVILQGRVVKPVE